MIYMVILMLLPAVVFWGTLIGRDMCTSIGIGRHEKTENHVTEQFHCMDLGKRHDLPEDFVDIPSAATAA